MTRSEGGLSWQNVSHLMLMMLAGGGLPLQNILYPLMLMMLVGVGVSWQDLTS